MTEAATLNPPAISDSTRKLPKDTSNLSIWSRISQSIWGPSTNEQFPEATPEQMAQALIASGRDPSDKCLPLVRLYDSAEEAQIAACRGKIEGEPKDPPMP